MRHFSTGKPSSRLHAACPAISSNFLGPSKRCVAFFLSFQPLSRRSSTSCSRKRVRLGSPLSLVSAFTFAKTSSSAARCDQPGPSNSRPVTVSRLASGSSVPGEGSASSSCAHAMSTLEATILFTSNWPTNLMLPITRVLYRKRFSSNSSASSGESASSTTLCFFFFFFSPGGCKLASKDVWHWSSRMRLKSPTFTCLANHSLRFTHSEVYISMK
mmetsp:Transcript_130334/g.363129  ORF Transcript_130334/g.363129 Transcript_130334/m.363129 type:complete len:215 (-) Transcript_130334:502-1146(-)